MRKFITDLSKAVLPGWAAKKVGKMVKKPRRSYPRRRIRRYSRDERSLIYAVGDKIDQFDTELKKQTKAITKLTREIENLRTAVTMIDQPKQGRKLDLEDQ